MNDVVDATPNPAPDAAKLESLKQLTMIIYILQAASFVVGITGIVAVVMNYVKRDDTPGTLYESHFAWQIRTFWWSLLWAVVASSRCSCWWASSSWPRTRSGPSTASSRVF